jgi:OOP family OmpA-OmpF porin
MANKSSYLVVATILSMLGTGCVATRNFVRTTVQPVDTKATQANTKVDQVSQQTQQLDAGLKQTNQQVQQAQSDISATKEIANAADGRATDALRQAGLNTTQIGQLRSAVANLDAYKTSDQAAVLFGFNRYTLTPEGKQQLDKIASEAGSLPRYFVTVEGFTDQTGSATYNDTLSRERANSVVEYLVGKGNVPVYRIHMVGLGDNQLVNAGKTRQDRTQSRRVEVAIFSAPALPPAGASSQ